MISPAEVIQNFLVSGSGVVLNYTKFSTTTLDPVTITVSNTSPRFAIVFFPTGSSALSYTTKDFTVVNKTYPLTLSPTTGSQISTIDLLVSVDTTGFNAKYDNTQMIYPVSFELVALTSSIVPTTNVTGSTTGSTTGGTTTSTSGTRTTSGTTGTGQTTGGTVDENRRRGFNVDDGEFATEVTTNES